MTSKSAATRGMIFLPVVVVGARIWLYWLAKLQINGARFSASPCAYSAPSATKTLATPETAAACAAIVPDASPATNR